MMRLWFGLHLPQLPLDVFYPRWLSLDDCAVAVLEQERVLVCSQAARRAGVKIGMRRAGVMLLAPQAQTFQRDEEREAAALFEVALAMMQYTPQVAKAEEATLLLDVGASLRLFGGVRALCRAVRASVEKLGFEARLSCAPTARAAWLLAQIPRRAGVRVLQMQRLPQALDCLPPAILPPAQPFIQWFEALGCTALADLQRLPRAGLQRRCGTEMMQWLDHAYGFAPQCWEWLSAPQTFFARIELFERLENAQHLLPAAQRLLQQLCGWLCRRQLALRAIQFSFEYERGRTARAPATLAIAVAEPVWHEQHLLHLLQERLPQLRLDAPVMALALTAPDVEPVQMPSADLFPEPGGSAADYQRLLELLSARLGERHVLQAAPQADHRPECANHWLPVTAQTKTMPENRILPRPCWLFAQPIALLVREQRPFYGSPLKLVSPPERIEAGWWNREFVTRDYFVAEGQDHAYYWIFRERGGGAEHHAPRWFLHGLFG